MPYGVGSNWPWLEASSSSIFDPAAGRECTHTFSQPASQPELLFPPWGRYIALASSGKHFFVIFPFYFVFILFLSAHFYFFVRSFSLMQSLPTYLNRPSPCPPFFSSYILPPPSRVQHIHKCVAQPIYFYCILFFYFFQFRSVRFSALSKRKGVLLSNWIWSFRVMKPMRKKLRRVMDRRRRRPFGGKRLTKKKKRRK